MTCIVGMVHNKTVYMGADSAGVAGFDIRTRKDPKVFISGEFIIGYTSSFRMGQILRYSFSPPNPREGVEPYKYMCTEFIDTLISTMKEKGFATVNNNEVRGGIFLVGYRGSLFEVESDFQVGEVYKNYASVGCGEAYALGALYSIEKSDTMPEERIKIALSAAQEFSAGVREPFLVEKKAFNQSLETDGQKDGHRSA